MERRKKNVKNQESDGYGRDKNPKIENLRRKEILITETRKITKRKKETT